MNKIKSYLDDLELYIKQFLKQNQIKNVVLGISGGIDSALALTILKRVLKPEQIFVYFIDIESNQQDYDDAKLICNHLNIKLNYIKLVKIYKQFVKKLNIKNLTMQANIKSRLRMITLYNQAFEHQAIVIGTTNFNELYLGYFTKFGDGAADLYILTGLIKEEIIAISQYLKLPNSIINKKPTSGLIPGVSDEDEIEVSYQKMNQFLKGKKIDDHNSQRLKFLHQKNKHKLHYNIYSKKMSDYK